MAEQHLGAQMQMLRSRVEDALKTPAVILVTSAARGDGKSLVAQSLADSFVKAGRHAALIHLTSNRAERSEVPEIDPSPNDRVPDAPERLETLVSKMRSRYDFTVVDGVPFLAGRAAISLAGLVDGVLLAVRVGRPQTHEDRLMMQTFERSGGRIMGVVAVEARAIAEFAKATATEER